MACDQLLNIIAFFSEMWIFLLKTVILCFSGLEQLVDTKHESIFKDRCAKHISLDWILSLLIQSTRNNFLLVYPIDRTDVSVDMLMEFEWARYESFQSFPESPAFPSQLAKAGFYHVGPGDTVRCFACHCTHQNWKQNDSPSDVHRRASPGCTLRGNIPIHGEEPQIDRARVPVAERYSETPHVSVKTGVSTDDTLKEDESCKHKQYKGSSERLNSFQNWPSNEIQSPKVLAEAGFFYTGTGDRVRCYACDIGFRNWGTEDNPWQEHQRYSPNCVHLRLNGHQGDVQSIHSDNSQSDFHLENGGAPSFEEWLSKNVAYKTLPRPSGLPVSNLESSLVRSIAERSSSKECEKQQYFQGTLYYYNLMNAKLHQLKEEDTAREKSRTKEISELKIIVEDLNQELKIAKEVTLCKICIDNTINTVLLPCGHVCCSQCSTRLHMCWMCRSNITERKRLYIT